MNHTKVRPVKITTNLSHHLLTWVDGEAKRREIARREFIENILERSFHEAKKEMIRASFRPLAEDQEERRERLAMANREENLRQLATFDLQGR